MLPGLSSPNRLQLHMLNDSLRSSQPDRPGKTVKPNGRQLSAGAAIGGSGRSLFHRRENSRPQQQPLQIVCRRFKDREREKEPQPYVVTVITPPPRSLGVHKFPPNMQCGETVEVKGEPFIVSSVTYRYHLKRGKYEPSQKRLDVQTTGRYLVNMFLDNLLDRS